MKPLPSEQTIDISAVNEPGLGHSAFAESKRVLKDIAEQLSGKSAEQRRLRNVQRPPTGYWVID